MQVLALVVFFGFGLTRTSLDPDIGFIRLPEPNTICVDES